LSNVRNKSKNESKKYHVNAVLHFTDAQELHNVRMAQFSVPNKQIMIQFRN
jgi:hypothetical protein